MSKTDTCEGCIYHEREDSRSGTYDYCWLLPTGRVLRKSSQYGGDYYPRKCGHKEATDE